MDELKESLHHKLRELWFRMTSWCHPKMVTPRAGRRPPWRRHCVLGNTGIEVLKNSVQNFMKLLIFLSQTIVGIFNIATHYRYQ